MRTKFISNKEKQYEIIDRCDSCFVSMVDNEQKPYLIPMNFGREDDIIYLHCAPEGKKVDIIKEKPSLCLGFTTDHSLTHQHEKVACSYFMRYRSVIAHGKAEQIEDADEKIRILNIVMRKYTQKGNFEYSEPAIKNVQIYKVKMTEITAKTMGYND
jgi:uncharacterized protein